MVFIRHRHLLFSIPAFSAQTHKMKNRQLTLKRPKKNKNVFKFSLFTKKIKIEIFTNCPTIHNVFALRGGGRNDPIVLLIVYTHYV